MKPNYGIQAEVGSASIHVNLLGLARNLGLLPNYFVSLDMRALSFSNKPSLRQNPYI